ncbi:hypothetical protein P6B95_19110 [Streptomyces atratus]|uniref:hypothetical protein n=1 Tax=Streptomyces atratus TaxID=1893 RepID=UPI00166FB871|nr:hypothetical protein [Streptomyces atratus]WPW29283.1 hypothetical protein P6B95_19110 [Streptomyces atratus]GGT48048.1 hypothetical protein GCM10010207_55890 [Streptomyces atratus]
MTDIDKLTGLFTALGADDAAGWADSEAEENIPQLARYRFLRMVWQDIDGWSTAAPDWVEAYRKDGLAGGAVGRALALGLTPGDLGEIAREVAKETAFGLLYGLADPADGDLPPEVEQQLPGWCLAELTPQGEPTGRILDALYEDLDEVEPQGPAGGVR